ncbi:N,N-dimethylformamidase beta subunit family domain-containing protein [Mycolicibacterium mengxianglii]|uniref:N,N-dimethylformamidase beta subunit family domain-containing protein n=1 Tax=Mycolicibacterium mengxianglii TaxID=2736649 RepID=UPI0018D051AF|nr:N,N-dimethylformamidase beta subunit family domain-containing protein [Mycolicibacterium mengxianglii]
MLTITGYSDRIYCRPGETVEFKVNCETQEYRADIVRIICGDTNPDGPGFKEVVIDTPASGLHPGRPQHIHAGSYVEIPNTPALESFAVEAYVWPTTPAKGVQGLITKMSDSAGFALIVDDAGSIALQVVGDERISTISTGRPMQPRRWYRVGARFDATSLAVEVFQIPLAPVPGIDDDSTTEAVLEYVPQQSAGPLYFAAFAGPSAVFNGKIDSPRIWRDAAATDLVGAWDFSVDMASQTAVDTSPHELHGAIVNFPARAMTGWNWTGEQMDFKQDPSQWGAMHFHDDDLYDAGWETDFELTIPETMCSGLYAARLSADGAQEYIPFTVGPAPGKEQRIALVLPTASYMAYGNDHLGTDGGNGELLNNILNVLTPPDLFLNEHWEYGGSLYDEHSDGSGICYSSRLRPLLQMRPKVQCLLGGFGSSKLWQFNADTHIVDWLHAKGFDVDIYTDEELHYTGLELLEPYAVVLTGSHPEYTSTEMWDAYDHYKNGGGRLVYLGGDGFYWRIAYHRDFPGIIELRRAETGVRAWAANPGEYYQNFDGRYGGLWLRQGRAPQTLVGVGFSCQGFDLSSYYRRNPDSFDPAVAFIFDGVGDDELIGDFGLIGGGAAGLELDRAGAELGTPPNAFILASSERHTNAYYLVPEEFLETGPALGADENPNARADLVFFETPEGGAVFSVGSIAWAGSLPWNNYDNNVSRITENVLQRFLDPSPFR